MKISIDEKELFTLSNVQKKVMMNDIHEDIFEEDIKRRLQYIIMHKYEQCYKRLKDEWEPKLKSLGVKSIPTNDEEFANLIFSQSEYKSRKHRESNQ